MAVTEDKSKRYYDYLSSKKDIDVPPSYESFNKTMQDENSRKKYYEYLKTKDVDVAPSYESFSSTLLKKKENAEPSSQDSEKVAEPSQENGGEYSLPTQPEPLDSESTSVKPQLTQEQRVEGEKIQDNKAKFFNDQYLKDTEGLGTKKLYTNFLESTNPAELEYLDTKRAEGDITQEDEFGFHQNAINFKLEAIEENMNNIEQQIIQGGDEGGYLSESYNEYAKKYNESIAEAKGLIKEYPELYEQRKKEEMQQKMKDIRYELASPLEKIKMTVSDKVAQSAGKFAKDVLTIPRTMSFDSDYGWTDQLAEKSTQFIDETLSDYQLISPSVQKKEIIEQVELKDENGEPVLNEDGTPKTETVLNGEALFGQSLQVVTDMAPMFLMAGGSTRLVSMLGAGTQTAPKIGMFSSVMAQTHNNAYEQAIAMGERDKANEIALTTGATIGLVNLLNPMQKVYTNQKAMKDFATSLINGKPKKQVIKDLLVNAGLEGTEESIEVPAEAMSNYLLNSTINTNLNTDVEGKEMLTSFILGSTGGFAYAPLNVNSSPTKKEAFFQSLENKKEFDEGLQSLVGKEILMNGEETVITQEFVNNFKKNHDEINSRYNSIKEFGLKEGASSREVVDLLQQKMEVEQKVKQGVDDVVKERYKNQVNEINEKLKSLIRDEEGEQSGGADRRPTEEVSDEDKKAETEKTEEAEELNKAELNDNPTDEEYATVLKNGEQVFLSKKEFKEHERKRKAQASDLSELEVSEDELGQVDQATDQEESQLDNLQTEEESKPDDLQDKPVKTIEDDLQVGDEVELDVEPKTEQPSETINGAETTQENQPNAETATAEETEVETQKVETKEVTVKRKDRDINYDVDFDENGEIVEIRTKKGKKVEPYTNRKTRSGKQSKVKNPNYFKAYAVATEGLTDNQIKEEDERKFRDAVNSDALGTDEYSLALLSIAEGTKMQGESVRKETGMRSENLKWITGFNKETDLPNVERTAEIILENAPEGVEYDMQEVRNALIDIASSYNSIDEVKRAVVDIYSQSIDPYYGMDVEAMIEAEKQNMSEEKLSLYESVEAEESLSDEELEQYYQEQYEKSIDNLPEEEQRKLFEEIYDQQRENQNESDEQGDTQESQPSEEEVKEKSQSATTSNAKSVTQNAEKAPTSLFDKIKTAFGLNKAESEATNILFDSAIKTIAKRSGKNVEEVKKGIEVESKEGEESQGAMVAKDGKAIIYALTNPNVSTPLHELAHVYEHYLSPKERERVLQAYIAHQVKNRKKGQKINRQWNVETSEFFARGFEKYLADGKSPSVALKKAFENFKQWLTNIYNGITGSDIDIELNDYMKSIYEKMLTSGEVESSTKSQSKESELKSNIDQLKATKPIDIESFGATVQDRIDKALETGGISQEQATELSKEVDKVVIENKGNIEGMETLYQAASKKGDLGLDLNIPNFVLKKSFELLKDKYQSGARLETAIKDAINYLRKRGFTITKAGEVAYTDRVMQEVKGERSNFREIQRIGETLSEQVQAINEANKEKRVELLEKNRKKIEKSKERLKERFRSKIKSDKEAKSNLVKFIKELQKSKAIKELPSITSNKLLRLTEGTLASNIDKKVNSVFEILKGAEYNKNIGIANNLKKKNKTKQKNAGFSDSTGQVKNVLRVNPKDLTVKELEEYIELMSDMQGKFLMKEHQDALNKFSKIALSQLNTKEKAKEQTEAQKIALENQKNKREAEKQLRIKQVELLQKQKVDGLSEVQEREYSFFQDITKEELEQLSLAQINHLIEGFENMVDGYPVSGRYVNATRKVKINRIIDTYKKATTSGKFRTLLRDKLNPFKRGIDSKKLERYLAEIPKNRIDDLVRGAKSQDLYKSIIQPIEIGYGNYFAETDKIKKGFDKLFSKIPIRKRETEAIKLSLIAIEKEYQNNKGSETELGSSEVNPIESYIEASRKAVEKDASYESHYKKVKKVYDSMLENGKFDYESQEAKLDKRTKAVLEYAEEVGLEMGDKIEVVAARQGKPITLRKYYTPLTVKVDKDIKLKEIVDRSEEFTKEHSLKTGRTEQRTPEGKALYFDFRDNFLQAAESVTLDYHLREPLGTVAAALNRITKSKDESFNEDLSQEQVELARAIGNNLKQTTRDVFVNQFFDGGFGDRLKNLIKKRGYQMDLASIPRAGVEFGSNLAFAMEYKPLEMMEGMKRVELFDKEGEMREFARLTETTQFSRLFDKSLSVNQEVGSDLYKSSTMLGRFVDYVNDKTLSLPDRVVAQPIWIGSFYTEFKKRTGVEFDVKAHNSDVEYRRKYKEALKSARDVADSNLAQSFATTNPFGGITNATITKDMGLFKSFKRYMTRFTKSEYQSLNDGINGMVGRNHLTKREGTALTVATISRMGLYMWSMSTVGNLFYSAIAELGGWDDGEDEEEDLPRKAYRSVLGSVVSLIMFRRLNNFQRIPIAFGIEMANAEWGDDLGLRENEEVDPYTESLVYSTINQSYFTSENGLFDGKPLSISKAGSVAGSFTGQYNKLVKTSFRAVDLMNRAEYRKSKKARERAKQELMERTLPEFFLETAGAPFPRDIRKLLIRRTFREYRDGN